MPVGVVVDVGLEVPVAVGNSAGELGEASGVAEGDGVGLEVSVAVGDSTGNVEEASGVSVSVGVGVDVAVAIGDSTGELAEATGVPVGAAPVDVDAGDGVEVDVSRGSEVGDGSSGSTEGATVGVSVSDGTVVCVADSVGGAVRRGVAPGSGVDVDSGVRLVVGRSLVEDGSEVGGAGFVGSGGAGVPPGFVVLDAVSSSPVGLASSVRPVAGAAPSREAVRPMTATVRVRARAAAARRGVWAMVFPPVLRGALQAVSRVGP